MFKCKGYIFSHKYEDINLIMTLYLKETFTTTTIQQNWKDMEWYKDLNA